MKPVIVFEDEHASIVYGHNLTTLGHLKIYPKPKVSKLEELPAKTIAHLFSLATRCASLLFDGMQAQGTNIILNEGKNANQQDDNICIDVIARLEKDELSFTWQPKQGDMEQVKQTANEISSKIVVYEKPPEPKPEIKHEKEIPVVQVKKEEAASLVIEVQPSPEEFGMEVIDTVEKMPVDHPVNEESRQLEDKKTRISKKTSEKPKSDRVTDEEFDKKTNFLLYELMRMP